VNDYFDQLASTWDQDPMKVERARATAECCKAVPLQERKRLLDFGGGTGLLSIHLQDCFDSITIADSSAEMLNVAKEKIKVAKLTNISTMKIEQSIAEVAGKYSAIAALMTLHHIADIEVFFLDAAKLLEEHGALLIADLYPEAGLFHQHVGDFTGHNGFDPDTLSGSLEQAGFKVTQLRKYYEISKKLSSGELKSFPLFFLVAEKQGK
jgi:cyclopropane fatty-acyl-phospholipid synthase-like methyltransferase